GDIERRTQNRVVQFFQDELGYDYLGNWQDRVENSNIEEDYLRWFLKRQGYSEGIIKKAVSTLTKAAGNQVQSLYDINKTVYSLLRYGVKVSRGAGENFQTVKLIDWEDPQSNHFAIAEEVTVQGIHNKRPDVVLYVNGIALGLIELKRSTVSVSEGIRQNLTNQRKDFIQPFFATVQLVMAANETEGLRYGVIETPEKYYLNWKEPSAVENLLARQILQICNKERLLEIIHDFIVFDAGVKKICRHSQYFGVKKAQARMLNREGGIIWHTQGSGKSLVMVWLSRWIREHIPESRILIITDRTELDRQIEGVYKGVDEDIYRCKSGADLIIRLNATTPPLICSLIHKFVSSDEQNYDRYIQDITASLPKDFRAKGDIFVFVDECHRTQSGVLHQAMKTILPDATFVGFTGTPLLKADKQKSIEVFGSYIHTYKFDEAVEDEVILDLRYEARDVDQTITSQEKIDQWFEAKTRGLNKAAIIQLKQRWGTMKKVLSSKSRLEQIVSDILLDMETKDRLLSGRGNAMLVAGSIYQACRYYKLFTEAGLEKCAIVTSYIPDHGSIRTETTGDGYTEALQQYDVYQEMLNGQSVDAFEAQAKEKFVHEPGQMKLLIVVDKLLTGFDAPPATYLYIDKKMQDHGLFQAICRVNRLDTEDKEYGYIIDYKDLFHSLEESVQDYTSGAFDAYDKEDVTGLLENRLEKDRERLEEAREQIKALCEPVAAPKGTNEYIRYFCGGSQAEGEVLEENEPKRIALYKYTAALIRAYANVANEMDEAGYTREEINDIKGEADYYEKVRSTIKLASGDYIDLKAYEPAMRHLIDTYIHAKESRKISGFDDITIVELLVHHGEDAVDELPKDIADSEESVAETIENNIRRKIIDETPVNPKYFERMSKLLDELVKERRREAWEYEEYLKKVVELAKKVQNPANSVTYPTAIDTNAKRALYDNLNENLEVVNALDEELKVTKKDGWRGNKIKEREVTWVIKKHVPEDQVDEILELIKNQIEY
ncbi:MAG: HsdR family type I site-specific deoxyribonuclease, partial [Chloroflexota bacterium]|nr:HsdR family type I site-specific deoxyribonuclease [Chloroflexota bacterium]